MSVSIRGLFLLTKDSRVSHLAVSNVSEIAIPSHASYGRILRGRLVIIISHVANSTNSSDNSVNDANISDGAYATLDLPTHPSTRILH